MSARARAGVIGCRIMTRAVSLALVVLASLSISCAEDEIQPESGLWVFVNGETVKNTCNNDMIEPASGDFSLINNGDGTFTVDPEDGSAAFLCDLHGDGTYACPKRLQQSTKIDLIDATLEVNVSASGSFSSPRVTSGQQDAIISCVGTQCDFAASAAGTMFPCELSATYTASFKQ